MTIFHYPLTRKGGFSNQNSEYHQIQAKMCGLVQDTDENGWSHFVDPTKTSAQGICLVQLLGARHLVYSRISFRLHGRPRRFKMPGNRSKPFSKAFTTSVLYASYLRQQESAAPPIPLGIHQRPAAAPRKAQQFRKKLANQLAVSRGRAENQAILKWPAISARSQDP